MKRLIKPLELLHAILSYLSANKNCLTETYKEAYDNMKNAIYQFNIRFRNIEKKFVDDVGSILFLLSKLTKQCKQYRVWRFNTIVSIFKDDYTGTYTIVRNFMQHALHADSEHGFTPKFFFDSYRKSFPKMIGELDTMIQLLTDDTIKEPEKNNIKFGDKEVTDFVKLMLKKEIRVAASGGAGAAPSAPLSSAPDALTAEDYAALSGGAGAAAAGGAGAATASAVSPAASGGAGAAPSASLSSAPDFYPGSVNLSVGAATASAALPADSENVKFAKRVIASRKIVRPRDNFPNMYTAEDHAKADQIMAASHAGGRRNRSRRNGKTKKQQRQRQRQTSRSRRNRKRA